MKESGTVDSFMKIVIPRPIQDKPYPLLRNFILFVVPFVLIGGIGLTLSLKSRVGANMEIFHAEHDQQSVYNIASELRKKHPEGWSKLFSGKSSKLEDEIVHEMETRGIHCLSIQSIQGKPLFNRSILDSCKLPEMKLFEDVLQTGLPQLYEDVVHQGYWSTFTVFYDTDSNKRFLFAVSRPSRRFENTVSQISTNDAVWFGVLLILSTFIAYGLIHRAQRSLNVSFASMVNAREQLQRFLSKAARANVSEGQSSAIKHQAVVLFADLRNFSGYAETHSVEETADLIDRFVTAVTDAVESHGGDVDKLLGDGMLAWFTGEGATDNAMQAAIHCIENCSDLPRRPGIGLFEGEVIAATLGKGDRMDFTILGRAVNLASRLCSKSAEDEITASKSMRFGDFHQLDGIATDTVSLKNHSQTIEIKKYSLKNEINPLA